MSPIVVFIYAFSGTHISAQIKKSISACVLAKSKLKKELQPEEARIICEKEIKN